MDTEEFHEGGLVLFSNTFEFEDFAEVGIGAVADVDEVCLH